jgi:hypothetical protein
MFAANLMWCVLWSIVCILANVCPVSIYVSWLPFHVFKFFLKDFNVNQKQYIIYSAWKRVLTGEKGLEDLNVVSLWITFPCKLVLAILVLIKYQSELYLYKIITHLGNATEI